GAPHALRRVRRRPGRRARVRRGGGPAAARRRAARGGAACAGRGQRGRAQGQDAAGHRPARRRRATRRRPGRHRGCRRAGAGAEDGKGKVTLLLNDVPWDQALDLVLRSNRLEKTQEGNVVRISTVSRLKEEREALRAAQDAERELEPLRVKYIRVNYAKADETLIEKVKGVLTDRGSVTFDDRTNTIIVRDIPHGTDDASQLI